jgi:hypothetical protein
MATLLATDDAGVRAAVDESRHLFEQMGAGLWLARLDAVVADSVVADPAARPGPAAGPAAAPASPAPGSAVGTASAAPA